MHCWESVVDVSLFSHRTFRYNVESNERKFHFAPMLHICMLINLSFSLFSPFLVRFSLSLLPFYSLCWSPQLSPSPHLLWLRITWVTYKLASVSVSTNPTRPDVISTTTSTTTRWREGGSRPAIEHCWGRVTPWTSHPTSPIRGNGGRVEKCDMPK